VTKSAGVRCVSLRTHYYSLSHLWVPLLSLTITFDPSGLLSLSLSVWSRWVPSTKISSQNQIRSIIHGGRHPQTLRWPPYDLVSGHTFQCVTFQPNELRSFWLQIRIPLRILVLPNLVYVPLSLLLRKLELPIWTWPHLWWFTWTLGSSNFIPVLASCCDLRTQQTDVLVLIVCNYLQELLLS